MKITDVKVDVLEIPLDTPFVHRSGEVVKTSKYALTNVFTDEGITGIAMGRGPVEEQVKELIRGEDPHDIEKIARKLRRAWDLNESLPIRVPGIDNALWDIIGKAAGQPVYKILGACRDKVRAYATFLEMKKPEEEAKAAVECFEKGYEGIKLKLHRPDIKEDIEVVKRVREAVGDAMEIMVDSNQAASFLSPLTSAFGLIQPWDHRIALKVARELEKYDITWLEEPLFNDDIDGYAMLVDEVDIPIATGEHFEMANALQRFREFLIKDAIDVCQPNVNAVGGLTQVKKIAHLAESFCKPCIVHGTRWAGLHASASNHNSLWVEVIIERDQFGNKMLKEPIEIIDGYIALPKKPGLGVEIDKEVYKKYKGRRDVQLGADR